MKYQERECPRHGKTRFRQENPRTEARWRCIKCSTEYRQRGRRRNKEVLVAEFGGKCQRCGYNKSIAALQFHHRDPATKSFGVGARQVSMSLERQREEAKKCDLICANCHAEIHYGVI